MTIISLYPLPTLNCEHGFYRHLAAGTLIFRAAVPPGQFFVQPRSCVPGCRPLRFSTASRPRRYRRYRTNWLQHRVCRRRTTTDRANTWHCALPDVDALLIRERIGDFLTGRANAFTHVQAGCLLMIVDAFAAGSVAALWRPWKWRVRAFQSAGRSAKGSKA